jgi:hypothetical protein
MPVTKIKITFDKVYVRDSADIWGDGEWHFTAKVEGKQVGDPSIEWVAKEKQSIQLPAKEWSTIVDVSAKKPSETVKVSFSGIDKDVISDDDLGEVKLELKYPFKKEFSQWLYSPVIKGWLFMPDHQYYVLMVKVQIMEVKATQAVTGPGSVLVNRAHDGSSTFSTLAGAAITPRVEVCPVVPPPASPSILPKRPTFPAELAPGKDTPQSLPTPVWPLPALNKIANPSLIPVLAANDPDLLLKAGRLAVTYVEPGDLDMSFLTWHAKEGPVEFVGGNSGPEVFVRGTDDAKSADKMATIEVRWDGDKGPLLATFRAWVGVIKQVPYRINIITGSKPITSPVLTPANVHNHLQMARVIHWQAGIELVPDPDKTCWDGASTTAFDGVFTVPAAKDNWTNGVNIDATPIATRLNYHPGCINIAYVRSCSQNRAVACDRGELKSTKQEDSGSPSASWILPSGVPPDDPAKKVTLLSMPPTNRTAQPAPGDSSYIKARQKVDASFKKDDLKKLCGVLAPSIWDSNHDSPDWGVNMAHELGHVLGLRHRGSGDSNNPPLSEDGLNCKDVKGKKRGHPWNENVMTYGYANGGVARAIDIDILQAPIVRKFPYAKAVT